MEAKRNACRVLVGTPDERDNLEDLYVGGKIILKWALEK
jgi:hypothetical protein